MLHRTLVWPDIHTPLHHEQSIAAALEFMKYWKPHRFIQLGDFCDFQSINRFELHYPEEFVTIDEELNAAKIMLDRIERNLPKSCDRYIIGGNHEANWRRTRAKYLYELPGRISRSGLRMKDSWGDELELTKRGWTWCEYGGHFQFGSIVYTHGWYTGNNACARMAKKFTSRNVIFGHTHKNQTAGSMDMNQLPIESQTIGCLARFDLSYLKGSPPGGLGPWLHAYIY